MCFKNHFKTQFIELCAYINIGLFYILRERHSGMSEAKTCRYDDD